MSAINLGKVITKFLIKKTLAHFAKSTRNPNAHIAIINQDTLPNVIISDHSTVLEKDTRARRMYIRVRTNQLFWDNKYLGERIHQDFCRLRCSLHRRVSRLEGGRSRLN